MRSGFVVATSGRPKFFHMRWPKCFSHAVGQSFLTCGGQSFFHMRWANVIFTCGGRQTIFKKPPGRYLNRLQVSASPHPDRPTQFYGKQVRTLLTPNPGNNEKHPAYLEIIPGAIRGFGNDTKTWEILPKWKTTTPRGAARSTAPLRAPLKAMPCCLPF